MSPALDRGLRKAIRTIVQVVASGGLTLAVDQFSGGLSPATRTYVGAAWLIIVVFAQNFLETGGTIKTLLPASGLITESPGRWLTRSVGVLADAKGTVEVGVSETGEIAGEVVDTAGEVVGDVSGQMGSEEGKEEGKEEAGDPRGNAAGTNSLFRDQDPDNVGGI